MAVLRTGRMLKMTNAGDQYVGRVIFHEIRFVGTNLTAGELLQITDINNSLITEHRVIAALEDAIVIGTGVKNFANGIKIASMPTGAVEVQIHLM
jgi:hypothetical protein